MKKKLPTHLSKQAKTWAQRLMSEFEFETHHIELLILAAEAWDRRAQAMQVLYRDGLTFTNRFGEPRSRPEVAIERDSRLAFARIIRQLGLDIAEQEDRLPEIGGRPCHG